MNHLAASDAGSTALGFVIWIAIILAYWTPTIIALFRWKDIPNGGGVIVLNFFGFTFVCWIIALVFAVRSKPRPVQVVLPQQPPYWGQIPPSV